MDALEESTTATAAPKASEEIKVPKADDIKSLVVDAAAADEPKHEEVSAAEQIAAALAAPEPEPAEAPSTAATTVQPEDANEPADAASEPAAPAAAPAAVDTEPVVAAPAAEAVKKENSAGDKEVAAAAEAAAGEGVEGASIEHAEPAAEEVPAGDASTAAAADSAADASAPGSALGSQEQKQQGDAADPADTTAAAGAEAIADAADAGAITYTGAASTADKEAAAAATDGEAAAAAARVEGTAAAEKAVAPNGDVAAVVDAPPPAGTVAAAKALFLRSQTSGDSATGTPTLAPLSMRSSRVSSASAGATRISSNGVLLVGGASLDDADEEKHIKVRELREQLSATHPNLTGGSLPPSSPPSPGREEREKGPLPLLSEHDKVNTVNVAELLRTAEFKLVPGIDRVPYEELIKLRLEDGVDVTRKEEYLSDEDFKTHLGVDREAYQKLPQWKKLQLKKGKMLF